MKCCLSLYLCVFLWGEQGGGAEGVLEIARSQLKSSAGISTARVYSELLRPTTLSCAGGCRSPSFPYSSSQGPCPPGSGGSRAWARRPRPAPPPSCPQSLRTADDSSQQMVEMREILNFRFFGILSRIINLQLFSN